MTNHHNISDLDKTCCVNCTELHSSLLTIISTHIFLCLIKSVICDGFQNWSWSSKGVLRQQWTGCKTEQVKMKKWLTSLAITRMSVIWMMMNISNTFESSLQKISWILSFRDIWQKWMVWYFLADILTLGDRLGPMWYLGNVWIPKMYVWLPPHSKKYFCHSGTNFTYLGGPAT